MRSRSEISPAGSSTFNDIQKEYDALMEVCAPRRAGLKETPEQAQRRRNLSRAIGTFTGYQYMESLKALRAMEASARQEPEQALSLEFIRHFKCFKAAATAIDRGDPMLPLTFGNIKNEYDALMEVCALTPTGGDESREQLHRKRMLSQMRGTYARYQYDEAFEGLQKLSPFAQHNSNERLSPEFMRHFARFKEAATAIDNGKPMTPPAFKMLPHNTAFHTNNTAVFVELRKMQALYERFCKPVEPPTAPTAEQLYWSHLVRMSKKPAVETDFRKIISRINYILDLSAQARLSDTMIQSFIDHFNRSASVLNSMLGYEAEPSHTPLQTRRKPQTFIDAEVYLRVQDQVRAASRTRSFLPWLKKAWYDAVLPLATEDMRERPDYMHYLFGQTGSNEDIGGFEFFAQAREGFKIITVFATALIKRVPRFLLFNLPAEMFNYFKGANAPDAKMRGFSIMSIPETLFRGAGFLFDALVSPAVSVIRIMRFLRESNIPFFGRKDVQDTGASLLSVAFVAGFAASVALIPLIGYWALASIGIGFALLTDMPLLAFVDLDNAEAPVSNSLEGVSESVSEAIAITDSDNNNSREPVFSKVLGNGSRSPKVTDDVPATSSSLTPAASN